MAAKPVAGGAHGPVRGSQAYCLHVCGRAGASVAAAFFSKIHYGQVSGDAWSVEYDGGRLCWERAASWERRRLTEEA